METLVDLILTNLRETDWSGPALFVVLILAVLVIFRKWAMFLLILLTIVLGWGAQDLIITNPTSNRAGR